MIPVLFAIFGGLSGILIVGLIQIVSRMDQLVKEIGRLRQAVEELAEAAGEQSDRA